MCVYIYIYIYIYVYITYHRLLKISPRIISHTFSAQSHEQAKKHPPTKYQKNEGKTHTQLKSTIPQEPAAEAPAEPAPAKEETPAEPSAPAPAPSPPSEGTPASSPPPPPDAAAPAPEPVPSEPAPAAEAPEDTPAPAPSAQEPSAPVEATPSPETDPAAVPDLPPRIEPLQGLGWPFDERSSEQSDGDYGVRFSKPGVQWVPYTPGQRFVEKPWPGDYIDGLNYTKRSAIEDMPAPPTPRKEQWGPVTRVEGIVRTLDSIEAQLQREAAAQPKAVVARPLAVQAYVTRPVPVTAVRPVYIRKPSIPVPVVAPPPSTAVYQVQQPVVAASIQPAQVVISPAIQVRSLVTVPVAQMMASTATASGPAAAAQSTSVSRITSTPASLAKLPADVNRAGQPAFIVVMPPPSAAHTADVHGRSTSTTSSRVGGSSSSTAVPSAKTATEGTATSLRAEPRRDESKATAQKGGKSALSGATKSHDASNDGSDSIVASLVQTLNTLLATHSAKTSSSTAGGSKRPASTPKEISDKAKKELHWLDERLFRQKDHSNAAPAHKELAWLNKRLFKDTKAHAYTGGARTSSQQSSSARTALSSVSSERNSDPSERNSDPSERNSDPSERNSDPSERNSDPSERNSDPVAQTTDSDIAQITPASVSGTASSQSVSPSNHALQDDSHSQGSSATRTDDDSAESPRERTAASNSERTQAQKPMPSWADDPRTSGMETSEVHSPLQIPTQRPPESAYPYMDATQRASRLNPPFWPLHTRHHSRSDPQAYAYADRRGAGEGYGDNNREDADIFQGLGGDVRMPTQQPPESAYPSVRSRMNEGGMDGYGYADEAYYPENRGVSSAYPHDDEGGEKDYYT